MHFLIYLGFLTGMIMNIYKVKSTFLASIEFKTETKETTQNGNWVRKFWSFAYWNIKLNNIRLSKDKEKISQSIATFKRQFQTSIHCRIP